MKYEVKHKIEEVSIDFENGLTLKLTKYGSIQVIQILPVFETINTISVGEIKEFSHFEVHLRSSGMIPTEIMFPTRDEKLITDIQKLVDND
jgi:hypothetical protein